MVPTKPDITALFQSQDAADLGVSQQGSGIMIANLNATNLPMCVGAPVEQLESDDVTIIMFVVDASPSMEGVRDLLIETFNEIMIEGLRGASKKTASEIVIGGLAFSTKIWPLFGGGFIRLAEMPKLTRQDYDPNRGHATNLYQAQLDGITAATAYAATILAGTGTPPKVIVVALTDGDDNVHGADPDDVKALVNGVSKELYRFPCAVFETGVHVDGRKIARDTGFDVFEFKQGAGETIEDVKRRFRHMMGTLSSSVISASQAQVGAPAASASFWTPATT